MRKSGIGGPPWLASTFVPVLLALSAAASCTPYPEGQRPEGAHGTLACAECHQGAISGEGMAAVPLETCTAAACHAADPGDRQTPGTARFTHSVHFTDATVTLECSGCHTHATGDGTLHAAPATCALCHLPAMAGQDADACRTCHGGPSHDGATSEGLLVGHDRLPNAPGVCQRCHFDLARPNQAVSEDRCVACHAVDEQVPATSMEGDLHPAHVGHACIDCHEGNSHQVWRMSSAVDLTCWACHGTEHDLTADTRPPNAVCSECHQGSHADQQALLLGILASGEAVEPAAKFMMGITCGSCHPAGAEESRPTQVVLEEAYTMCHGPRHATVLRWWTDGMDARLADTRRYLENAERAAGDERGERLLRARESFDVVAGGGAIHNPILAHRLMAEVAEDARSTYVARGALPPGPPYLGAAPELGTCSGCHYDLRMEATGSRFPMTDAFHREVLGRWAGR